MKALLKGSEDSRLYCTCDYADARLCPVSRRQTPGLIPFSAKSVGNAHTHMCKKERKKDSSVCVLAEYLVKYFSKPKPFQKL
jgi:hypothetical protein